MVAAARSIPVTTHPAAPARVVLGLTRDELIHHLRVKPETVDGWLAGTLKRPPYFDLAVKAAKIGLHPISSALVYNYHKELGVEQSRVKFWRETGQTPVPARMAVAWVIHARVTGRN